VTAILTQRCDPFGIERERYGEKLAGGIYSEASVGKYIWHCEEAVTGRYKFICRGGEYGFRRQNDGGVIAAYRCDGGHTGLPMCLCKIHVAEMSAGPPPPGWSKDKKNSYGQIGGTVSNEMCPRCIAPPQAREFMARADFLQSQLSAMVIHGILSRVVAIQSELDQVRARLDELHERGIIHKCPLRLVEVS
jgi:hypothetical protein